MPAAPAEEPAEGPDNRRERDDERHGRRSGARLIVYEISYERGVAALDPPRTHEVHVEASVGLDTSFMRPYQQACERELKGISKL